MLVGISNNMSTPFAHAEDMRRRTEPQRSGPNRTPPGTQLRERTQSFFRWPEGVTL